MTKKYILLLLFISISFACFSQNQGDTVIKSGVGLGSVIAVVISWDRNKSILWAILHGIFSWLYVIYYALTRD
ncbi:hypothetical protein [Winogradskyella psychrotolerans]|uniref:hypothetical protein n=1 Tax=Winogradskyella psychrotolerans TaxID=1344585 RepID=UPI002090FB97|nr:hypothetical protein [Winogradskyella psychrotolerans]